MRFVFATLVGLALLLHAVLGAGHRAVSLCIGHDEPAEMCHPASADHAAHHHGTSACSRGASHRHHRCHGHDEHHQGHHAPAQDEPAPQDNGWLPDDCCGRCCPDVQLVSCDGLLPGGSDANALNTLFDAAPLPPWLLIQSRPTLAAARGPPDRAARSIAAAQRLDIVRAARLLL